MLLREVMVAVVVAVCSTDLRLETKEDEPIRDQ